MKGKIINISGPIIIAQGLESSKMNNIVYIGDDKLIGEIVKIEADKVIIQVYEDTTGLKLYDPVEDSGEPLSVELGPGLIGSIFDGIQRPLDKIFDNTGPFISRGFKVQSLDREKKWHFKPIAKINDIVNSGDWLGEVDETPLIKHRIIVPPNVSGKIKKIVEEGEYKIDSIIAVIDNNGSLYELKMLNKWPVRIPRPYKEKLLPNTPLITGQRIIDSFFPIAKGGTAAIPGGFGTGKTVTLHTIAKFADADIIIYCGTGERGNEMTDVLNTFSTLKDPKTGRLLMERTIMIANTSNMPVVAREASIYTSIAIAEYYRDMGYDVALMADSTSRWAEALREISGRMGEMPGEEGYPAYLGKKISEFYERAGKVRLLNNRLGSITVMGAVSPSSGDISEPVSQNTLRITKVLWALDSSLANSRHFPAINWINSYSLYINQLDIWYKRNVGNDWPVLRNKIMEILQKEDEINEIVQLVGYESLPEGDKLILDIAKIIREDFLQQNAFDEVDQYSSIDRQYKILSLINKLYSVEDKLIKSNKKLTDINTDDIKKEISLLRYTKEDKLDQKLEKISKMIMELLNYGN